MYQVENLFSAIFCYKFLSVLFHCFFQICNSLDASKLFKQCKQCKQCERRKQCLKTVKAVRAVYSAVLPPTVMVFFSQNMLQQFCSLWKSKLFQYIRCAKSARETCPQSFSKQLMPPLFFIEVSISSKPQKWKKY